MPFKSERQRRYLWAKKPKVAREFADAEKRRKAVIKQLRKR